MPNTHLIRVGAVPTAAALTATAVVLVATLIVYPGLPIGIAIEGVALIVLLFALEESGTSLICLRWRRTSVHVAPDLRALAVGRGPGPRLSARPTPATTPRRSSAVWLLLLAS
jgi:hypothetical protein